MLQGFNSVFMKFEIVRYKSQYDTVLMSLQCLNESSQDLNEYWNALKRVWTDLKRLLTSILIVLMRVYELSLAFWIAMMSQKEPYKS